MTICKLLVALPLRQVYSHLMSLCDGSREFAICLIQDPEWEDDPETYRRCAIIDTRRRGGWIDNGPFRKQRFSSVITVPRKVAEKYKREGRLAELFLWGHPEEMGGVIGTIRLLAVKDRTTLTFSLKDALWHEEITEEGAAHLRKFEDIVTDYLETLGEAMGHVEGCPASTEEIKLAKKRGAPRLEDSGGGRPNSRVVVLPDPTAGGRYGTSRDLTAADVQKIVDFCREFVDRGGKVPDFYNAQEFALDSEEPRSYALETLRCWLKDPKFMSKGT